MDVFEAIAQRYSYRGAFVDQPVPRADLMRIVQAGAAAPSGCNAQSPRFLIIEDRDLRAQIAALMPPCEAIQTAPAMIFVTIDQQPAPTYEGMAFQVEDCAAAVENMLLAITALGYATVWFDGILRAAGRSTVVARLLGVPEDKQIRVMLPLGVPVAEGPRREKLPLSARCWIDRWGGTPLSGTPLGG